MAKKGGPSIQGMHIAFGIASILLLVTTLLAFVQDHFGREFLSHQENYDKTELHRLQTEQAQVQAQLQSEDMKAEVEELRAAHQTAKAARDARQADIVKHKDELQKIDDKLQLAVRTLNFDRGIYDEIKYLVDIKQKSLADLTAQEKKIEGAFTEVANLKTAREAKVNEIAAIEAEHKKIETEINRIVSAQADVETKIRKHIGNPIINIVRDAPGIDIVDPRRKIDQVVLNNLPVDVLFAKTMRVDRCVTCHKGIDNVDPLYGKDSDGDDVADAREITDGTDAADPASFKAESKVDKVLRAHPRLDLFVGSNSKHSYRLFGCTICHQGRPMGTSFVRAAHMPRDAKQAKEWEHKYHWEPMHYWDQKMLPVQHTEASCLKCHKGTDNIPEAHKLNEGRELFRNRGCANCHMGSSGDKDMAWVGRVGPDLRRIGEKTDANWTRHWIENPWDFRPTTKMPRFFGLENRTDLKIGEHARDPIEVEAITTYLFASSQLRQQQVKTPPPGDVEAGRKLFQVVGCVGCHSTRETKDKDKVVINNHGPDLSRIGEKVNPGWLFSWVKHPNHYWPETKMPDLRLSEKEAADITAYLLQTMKSDKKAGDLGTAPESAFEFMIGEKLSSTTTKEGIAALLKEPQKLLADQLKKKVKYITNVKGETVDSGDGEWTHEQIDKITSILGNDSRAIKAFYAGEMLIQQHGCFGCHNIQGWTYSPLTCVNLMGEGDKDLEKFAFGKTLSDGSIQHTKWDWFYTKIARPRVYDMGQLDIIKPLDRLRMPWFGYPKVAHDEDSAQGPTAEAAKEGAHAEHYGEYHPRSNKDESSPYGLSHTQIERLVTHLLSLTNEPIPVEMQRAPSPQDVAIDRGQRVIRELNCTGCHVAGVETKALPGLDHRPTHLPLEALVALTTPQVNKKPDDGIFLDEDVANLEFADKQDSGAGLNGFINLKRGTYLTGLTAPLVMSEAITRSHQLEPQRAVGFRLERKQPKQKKGEGEWVAYGDLVPLEKFKQLTMPIFFEKEDQMTKAYDRLSKLFVDQNAYERMAGTLAVQAAGRLTFKDVDDRKQGRTFFPPVYVKVRFTKGEGKVIPYIIKLEEERQTPNAGQQQAPPSLSFEGGKVQPDWLYQFLHNVHVLRWGLNIRMPSFWNKGPHSDYKIVYPTGHLSAVDPAKRPKGIGGEPLPGPEAIKVQDISDDAQQVVDFFIADAKQKHYGHQAPPMTPEMKKLYDMGKQLVTGDEKAGGMGCVQCHAFGNKLPNEPKWAPNLAFVKDRLQDDWVKRFLVNPQSIYPWANMPNNFKFDWQEGYNFKVDEWHRGLLDGDEAKFKENADKLRAVKFFLMRAGDGEIGN
ncbi:MAG TPA: c-type cytochrome [Planctomycetota bacterium]|nr:c-type cytochrome [Planctomycetota bacterium]